METRFITTLTPHPRNKEIYGALTAPHDLIESIGKVGMIDPLLITFDDRIISGHRRWLAAQQIALESVPVVVSSVREEHLIVELMIEANRQREKTNEMKMNEAAAIAEVEQEKGKQRQAAHGKTAPGKKKNTSGNVSTSDKEKTRDAIGKKIGVSGKTAEKAMTLKKTVDELKAKGHAQEAEALLHIVNKKGFAPAFKQAQMNGHIAPKKPKKESLVLVGTMQKYITLEAWGQCSPEQQEGIIANASRKAKEGFNEQKTDFIEWARWSWNPVVGCLTNCVYCYARDIAVKTYPNGFAPAFVPSRLWTPSNIEVPEQAKDEIGFKNVFVCSMADLFGKWVPKVWIEAVLEVVRKNKQWNFLFLTKFPLRLAEFVFPNNAWVGTSVDCQTRVENAEKAFKNVTAKVKWLSCEPLLEPIQFKSLDMFDWVVIGGASKSTETPEFRPPRAWVNSLWEQAREAGCKIYEKTNLLERVREYPDQHDRAAALSVETFHYPLLSA